MKGALVKGALRIGGTLHPGGADLSSLEGVADEPFFWVTRFANTGWTDGS